MLSFLFLQPDIQSYHTLQVKLSDTLNMTALNMAAAINATIEKRLKRDHRLTPKYFNWLHMENGFDIIQYQAKSLILIYSLYPDK